SIDGFPPAAMRYTESRLSRYSRELLEDCRPEIVPFQENFDGEEIEPIVLPTKLPNLLLNGAQGIAVGMSSNIPPHNLTELLTACILLIDEPNCPLPTLLQTVSGPDFPTGGTIVGFSGIYNLYTKGRGAITIRSRYHIEEPTSSNKYGTLIITEIPYLTNKATLVTQIEDLRRNDVLKGVRDVKDLSKNEIRIELTLDQGYESDSRLNIILAQLIKKTHFEKRFHARNLAFVGDQPQMLTLRRALQIFLEHREDVYRKKIEFILKGLEERLHIVEGLVIAVSDIENVIRLIRASADRAEASKKLQAEYSLSERQAKAVLDMALARLAHMEINKLMEEKAELEKLVAYNRALLNDRKLLLAEIKKEFIALRDTYGDERRTDIIPGDEIGHIEADLVHEKLILLTVTKKGYVRAIKEEVLKSQGRGGMGVIGIRVQEDDIIQDMLVTSNKDILLLVSDLGKIYSIPAYHIPEVKRRDSRGSKITQMIPVEGNIVKIIPVDAEGFDPKRSLFFITRMGVVKRASLDSFSRIRKTGIICAKLNEGDQIIDVLITSGNDEIFVASLKGKMVRFNEDDVRVMGRNTVGVRGMRLAKKDEVVGGFTVLTDDLPDTAVLTLSANGKGKRTASEKYRLTKRGAGGVINIRLVGDDTVAAILPVPREPEEKQCFTVLNADGKIIKIPISDVREMGRSTQGVRIMRMKKDENRIILASRIKALEDISEEHEKVDSEDNSS
ncbi:MAG: hypothetical protein KAR35_09280, partial [Candidatus Heimdallarchaeota archaeon]|nr:hypothetical protein [Candidatus Heimdallarchaeota archaeon]